MNLELQLKIVGPITDAHHRRQTINCNRQQILRQSKSIDSLLSFLVKNQELTFQQNNSLAYTNSISGRPLKCAGTENLQLVNMGYPNF